MWSSSQSLWRNRFVRLSLAMLFAALVSSSSWVSAQSSPDSSVANAGMVISQVWEDLNRNGLQEDNEPGLADVMVTLLDCDGGYVESRRSNQLGVVPFVASAGCYRLSYAAVEGYQYCPNGDGSNPWLDSNPDAATRVTDPFDIRAGNYLIDVDAGIMKIDNSQVGDRIWHDLNADGLQDLNEPGLAGVPLQLMTCDGEQARDFDGVPISTQSNSQGYFMFENLTEGCYKIAPQLDEDAYITSPLMGDGQLDSNFDPATGFSENIQLSSAQGVHHIDLGVYRQGRIGDYVWVDDNRNGIQESAESGRSGVLVMLLSDTGVPLGRTTTTDNLGHYAFEDLKPGSYRLQFVIPEDFVAADVDQGSSDELDNDANSLGVTETFEVVSDQSQNRIDFGVIRRLVLDIAVEALTNGEDADKAPGPYVPVGSTVQWEYIVTNTGTLQLFNVVLEDSQGVDVTCPVPFRIPVGESATCTASTDDAQAGQYENIVTVSGEDGSDDPPTVTAMDLSHYFGADPSVAVEVSTNGDDADTPPGTTLTIGGEVVWEYVVVNTGNVPLTDIVVVDNNPGVVITCPSTMLQPGEEMTCVATGVVQEGQYANIGTVTSTAPIGAAGSVTDSDPSHYLGLPPALVLRKFTNGEEANIAPGPTVPLGEPVEWTYELTNNGPDLLTDLEIIDDQNVVVVCPQSTVSPGETVVCTGQGTATSGQYMNSAQAFGQIENKPADPSNVAVSHYFGSDAEPNITIETRTNNQDADTPTGPNLFVDSPVFWDYTVTNTGNVTLSNVVVTDDQGVTVTCPSTTLAVGESFTCTASGTVTIGQYANLGTVTAVNTEGEEVTATDPSHHFGVFFDIGLEKFTNGVNGDQAPGVTVLIGETVTWTYEITNNGNVAFGLVTLEDDQLGPITCPQDTLDPNETITCTATGVATAGQYMNIGEACGFLDEDKVCDDDPSHYFGGDSGITIEKSTNGEDADVAPGPTIAVGDAVNWVYLITNTGSLNLDDVVVSDDQGVTVTCPTNSIPAGESLQCTGTGTATLGQYSNIGSVTGQPVNTAGEPVGEPLTTNDPSHYFGAGAALAIEKTTNGVDADVAPGPTIGEGETVNWVYTITNNGNVEVTDIVVSDDQNVAVSCPMTSLAPGASMDCTGSGVATAGQYANIGDVTGQGVDIDGNPVGDPVSAEDPSHYFGGAGGLSVEKSTNGVDADVAPGPTIAVGETVTWVYTITNNGNLSINNVNVTDDQGVAVSCPMTTLAAGESMDCTGSGTATLGQYANIGTVSGQPVDDDGNPVGDPVSGSDPSHYLGGQGGLGIEKSTNGQDADSAPGPTIAVGDAVEWIYTVTNLGNLSVNNIVVTDDQGVTVTCPMTTLAAGASMDCTGSGTATSGQYANIGSVTGQPVDGDGNPVGEPIDANDPSHYFGGEGGLTIDKSTNGQDADSAPGPTIAVGDTVTWAYTITNNGNLDLNDVVVSDDQGVVVTCPMTTLAAGASMECTGSGVATIGQYANIGSVSGQPVDDGGNPVGDPVGNTDPSHYFGGEGGLSIEKTTNGIDADVAPGPTVAVGSDVAWVYTITNDGNLNVDNINVTDDQGVTVTCPMTTLAAGESMECTGSGAATAGQYANIGSVTGQPVDDSGNPIGSPVGGTDPSHYFGGEGGLSIEKSTNDQDADLAPGPFIGVGEPVAWTYTVTNNGNLDMINLVVTDDQGVAVFCSSTSLAAGESIVCTGSGLATQGQYSNIGSVTGQGVDDNGNPVGDPSTASDPSHYFGGEGELSIEKSTNGVDADVAPGPTVETGSTVNWLYTVTNTGNLDLINVLVTDDQGVAVTCPLTTLIVGQSMDCTGNGIATTGQYANVGSVTGQGVDNQGEPIGSQANASDPSHYFGGTSGLSIEKSTNGADADVAPGPTIAVGDTVTWVYTITNNGNLSINNITVTDDQGVVVTCPMTTLAAGASMDCTGTGTATAGQYANIGSASGQPVDEDGNPVGDPVGSSDPSHYFGGAGGLSIEKSTNGADADVAPGPTIAVGDTVSWIYTITNNGNLSINNVNVTDDQGVVVTCPMTTLAAGASMDCTGSGTATAGQYANIGSASGQPVDENGNPVGDPVGSSDPSHYFGGTGGLSIEKSTNGADADVAPGPTIAVGDTVTWVYTITNNGNLTINNVSVTDDQGVAVSCPMTTLAAGASMDCTGTGTATAGQYANIGSASGQPVDENGNPVGDPVGGSDPSHYFGGAGGLSIDKSTNGVDADVAPGPTIAVGDAVTWIYTITNNGNLTINNISVTDDQGVVVTCPMTTLAAGASMDCTGTGTATAGQYANIGSASGQPVDEDGNPVGDPVGNSDPSHYFGGAGGLSIEKSTNGADADVAPGPTIAVGDTVSWIYTITNNGNLSINNVIVTDDQGVVVTCPMTTLAAGASMDCTGSGTATAGQYANIGSASGQPVDEDGNPVGDPVGGSDPSHYFGGVGGLSIEKSTNGVDADVAPGPTIAVGDTVTWVYTITNNGNLAINNVSVTDDQGVAVSCPMTTLAAGASMDCTGTGTATAGQYANIGSASGQPVDENGNPVGDPVGGSDPSHYFGGAGGLSIEKSTNGADADVAPGPTIAVGDTVSWIYTITNNGNLSINNINVTDDQGVVVTCPMTTLAAGASMDCTGTGTATAGQYANIGSASGQPVDENGNPVGDPVGNTDPSHYFGGVGGLSIDKSTNGADADVAPGPTIAVGDLVTWVYTITNNGNLAINNISVTDDQGVVVSCPMTILPAGESMDCTGTGTATAGQYANIGTVSGQPVDENGNPVGNPIGNSDPSHYFGGAGGLTIEKSTNGVDADVAPGPEIIVGEPVQWLYTVANTGNVGLVDVVVSDNQGVAVSCPMTTLAIGETMTCTGIGVATLGQYSNIGSVVGQGVDGNGDPVGGPQTASDPSHYIGLPLPTADLGDRVFVDQDRDGIQDPGEVGVPGVTVNLWIDEDGDGLPDTQVSSTTTDADGNYLFTDLDTSFTYVVQFVAIPGSPFTDAEQGGDTTADSNPNPATGITGPINLLPSQDDLTIDAGVIVLTSGVSIEKTTNGVDADTPTGPEIPVGDAVVWEYTVTNTGELALENVQVTDDQGVAVTCSSTSLAVGATLTCTGEGIALAGQYSNIGSVTAQPVDGGTPVGDPVNASDPSHYFGLEGCVPGFVLDQFNHVSYDNNDGDMNWSGGWKEFDPQGGGASSGAVMVAEGKLVLRDYPNSGEHPWARRKVDLSDYLSAMLMFDWSTSNEVDDNDSVVLEISSDNGQSYTVIRTYTGLSGANGGSEVIDISQYISANTIVRFRIDAYYGAQWDKFMVDNVRIDKKCEPPSCVPGYVKDHFSHVSYHNNDGSMDWTAGWMEHDPQGGGASNGSVKISDGQLILRDYPNSGEHPSIRREVDLSNHTSSMLQYKWSTSDEIGPEDKAVVEISSDGGSTYTILRTYHGLSGWNGGTEMIDISAYNSANTVLRFRIAEYYGGNWDKFMIDFVRIDKKCDPAPEDPACIATSAPNHALWMSGFNSPSDVDRFNLEAGAEFIQLSDGTARLTGTVIDDARPDRRFSIDMNFAGRTTTPPPGSPKNNFGADTSDWEYYPNWSGTLVGLDDYSGAVLNLTRRGPSMQVGTGANDQPNEEDEFGASAWLDWQVSSQPSACSYNYDSCIEHSGHGDLNIRLSCGGPQSCVADADETPYHAVFLPDFNDDDVLDRYNLEDGAEFVRNPDGTASFEGVIFKNDQPNYRFNVELTLSGGTSAPPPGSPYNPHNASTADWYYYPNWSGTFTGLTWNEGALLTIERRGASFQVGTGANAHQGEQNEYGGSGWFDWQAQSQPHDCHYYGDCIKWEGDGDINIRIDECPIP